MRPLKHFFLELKPAQFGNVSRAQIARYRSGVERPSVGYPAWDILERVFPDVDWIPYRIQSYTGKVSNGLGTALVELLARRNYTTSMLATALGCASATVTSMIRGDCVDPGSPYIAALCRMEPAVDWLTLASRSATSVTIPLESIPGDSQVRERIAEVIRMALEASGKLR